MTGFKDSGSPPFRHFLKRLSYTLLPGHCVACSRPSLRPLDLCATCESDLPTLGNHCAVCAVPIMPASFTQTTAPVRETATIQTDKAPGETIRLHCGTCIKRPPAFAHIHTPYLYQAPIDRLLWRFKFSGDLVAGKVLGQLLARSIKAQNLEMPDGLIPVPLHWRRRFGRGFNQARELSNTLGKALNIPRYNDLLGRAAHTPTQQGLNRQQRQRNLRRAFELKPAAGQSFLEGKSFVIVDDIVTTCSTADTIAALLLKGGAAEVRVWAVARTPLAN